MLSQVHFAPVAVCLSAAIAGLLWVMACAITANEMEREGLRFWKGFVACFFLTPLVGLLAIGAARWTRHDRPLVQTVTRG
jgi:hypothetical protein